jgi:hypothetical protein
LGVEHHLKILDGVEQQCYEQTFIQTNLGLQLIPIYNLPIYNFVPVNWIKKVGNLTQIDNGLTTDVWGVDSSDYVYRLREDNTWEQIEGLLKHVSTGKANVLF